jgi:hypothetical protein
MITKTFEYNVPDYYGCTTDKLNLTQQGTYEGPKKMYVKLGPDNSVNTQEPPLIIIAESDEEILESWCDDCEVAVVDAEKHTLIAAMLIERFFSATEDEDEDSDAEQEYHFLPGENKAFFSHNKVLELADMFNISEIYYNKVLDRFDIPYLDLCRPLEDDAERRARKIQEALDFKSQHDFDDSVNKKIDRYIEIMQEIPTKFKDYPQCWWPEPCNPDFFIDDAPWDDDLKDEYYVYWLD